MYLNAALKSNDFLFSCSQEYRSRPAHIHEYMPPQYPEMETESGPVVPEDGDPKPGDDLGADGTAQVKTEGQESGQDGSVSVKKEPEDGDGASAAGAVTSSKDPTKSADFNPFKGENEYLFYYHNTRPWIIKSVKKSV